MSGVQKIQPSSVSDPYCHKAVWADAAIGKKGKIARFGGTIMFCATYLHNVGWNAAWLYL
jgi:hypothetical protein